MKKDIDVLKKRSRRRRNAVEKTGSASLVTSGLVGLFFLVVLVWQIAIPTFIEGEVGELEAASEFIPISEYVLEWDNPNTDENGFVLGDAIVLMVSWKDVNGTHEHEVEIRVHNERGVKEDVFISPTGVSTELVEVGKKTKFYLKSTLTTSVFVEQLSGPVPAADATGKPTVSSFVISGEVDLFVTDSGLAFEPLALLGWSSLLAMMLLMTKPIPQVLPHLNRLNGKGKHVRNISIALAITTCFIDGFSVSSCLGALCWLLVGTMVNRMVEGIQRLQHQGRRLSEIQRLNHSISNRDGMLMWSRMLLVAATLFIPLDVNLPFLTERYQDIFQPYSSGIRSAFFGTIWVMAIAMLVSMPISIGAAIYLEEYASPTKTTKLIQALVTNLAGVPSIVFGMFGLAVFVKQGGIGLGLGPSILAAGFTMGVMAMPIIVLASQEALRSVPTSLRESAYGVGCTQWQVVKDHILPSAMPGILTGSILAMSRIMGEAAPLVVVGAAALVLFDPEPLAGLVGGNLNFTVIPIQIYFWTSEPGAAWHSMAAAASIALILLLVAMNSIAIILRQHFRRRLNS
jgi:phosphate transport system permease protein